MVEDEQQYARTNGLSYTGYVIVESGACSLETKARNIQDMGGQVALIVSQDSAGVFEEINDDKELVNEAVQTEMYDGTGASIHIPTILVSPTQGNYLINMLEDEPSAKVVLKADFETTT